MSNAAGCTPVWRRRWRIAAAARPRRGSRTTGAARRRRRGRRTRRRAGRCAPLGRPIAGFGFEAAAAHYRPRVDGSVHGPDRGLDRVRRGAAAGWRRRAQPGTCCSARRARQSARSDRAVDLAQAALALGGGLAGFEVPIRDDEQADLLRRGRRRAAGRRGRPCGRRSVAGCRWRWPGTAPLDERVALAQDAVRMARDAGDREIESAVLAAYCDAIAGPGSCRASASPPRPGCSSLAGRHAGRQACGSTRPCCSPTACCWSPAWSGATSRRPTSRRLAYERVARRLNIPRYALVARDLAGHAGPAGRQPGPARCSTRPSPTEIGRRADSVNAELMVFTVRMQAHLDRGTAEQFTDDVTSVAGRDWVRAGCRRCTTPGRPGCCSPPGTPATPRAVLRAFLTGTAESMPKDAEWLEAIGRWPTSRSQLDDQAAAAAFSRRCARTRSCGRSTASAGAVFGAVAEQLGRLAAYLGRPDEPTGYLGRARERYVRQARPALLRRVDARSHRPRGRRGPPDIGRLHRDGQRLADRVARPAQHGARFQGPARPGGPARPARSGGAGARPRRGGRRSTRRRGRGPTSVRSWTTPRGAPTGAGWPSWTRIWPTPTPTPTSAGWSGCAPNGRMLADQLAGALGLGGRPRIAGDPADRARKAVTMRIRAAISHDRPAGRAARPAPAQRGPHRPGVQLQAGEPGQLAELTMSGRHLTPQVIVPQRAKG